MTDYLEDAKTARDNDRWETAKINALISIAQELRRINKYMTEDKKP